MSPSDWVSWTWRQLHTEWRMEVLLGDGRQEWAEEAVDHNAVPVEDLADPTWSSGAGLVLQS